MSNTTGQKTGIHLRVTSDRMKAYARSDHVGTSVDEALTEIRTLAEVKKIVLLKDEETLREALVEAVTSGDGGWEVLIAEGVPPVPPVDEYIEWARDFWETGFKIDPEHDRADYREHVNNRNVVTDEFLARIVPGRHGQPGTDVFGKPIPVAPPRTV